MMLRDCILLLPGYELEGYPRSLPAPAAAELLSGWIALWHPRLLASAAVAPRWQSASQLPGEPTKMLFILPSIASETLQPNAREQIADGGSLLLEAQAGWCEFQQRVVAAAESAGLVTPMEPNQGDLVDALCPEFAALGYAYLQIQLMTRQLRYTSNLDQLAFGNQVTDAAGATLAGDRAAAARLLAACFDTLGQERDHYYSLDVQLLDVTLLAETTLGKSLAGQLTDVSSSGERHSPAAGGDGASENGIGEAHASEPHGRSTTFVASGRVLRRLRELHPATADNLRAAIDAGLACLAGGLDSERPHPLMTRETSARDFFRGREAYRAAGFEPPRIFARQSFGLAPESVSLLRRLGFEGCLLIAWAGGKYPEGSQAKISWEAPDGTFLAAVATDILDAADANSFLSLGLTIGDALDHQHVPTLLFAHWPNRVSEFLPLLDIISARTPALGRWRTAQTYFDETDQPYHQERLAAAGFQYNWLLEADQPAELLRAVKEFQRLSARCRGLQNLCNLAWQLERFRHRPAAEPEAIPAASEQAPNGSEIVPSDSDLEPQPTATTEPIARPPELHTWAPELAELLDVTDSLLDSPADCSVRIEQSQTLANQICDQVLRRLAKQLQVAPTRPSEPSATTTGTRLMFNPRSYPVRVPTLTAADTHLIADASWHFAEGRCGRHLASCVDIPAQGFVAARLQSGEHRGNSKQRPLADAGGLLNNEFLEVQIDAQRGHLRSLHIPAKRGNRLSFMLARRDRKRNSDSKLAADAFEYSEMIADNVRMLTSSNINGLIRASGRLEMHQRTVAKFEIDYELWRGSRIVEVTIRLSDLAELDDGNPWRSAYIARLAWPTESALLRTFAGGYRNNWSSGRAVAPTLIEIDETDYHTHYLTGGLSFHRRTEERFLETLLAGKGERVVEHRIGLAVDLPYPLLAAAEFLDQPYQLDSPGAKHSGTSGWLATVDTKNVMIDFESPLVNEADELVGARLFLSETEGRSTTARVRLLREIQSANRVDYLGGQIGKLTTDGDRLTIAMRSNEQVNVDVIWKR